MSESDILSVRLFIGALAATAAAIAMTQAGWTHKWFVRGMFSLSFGLAAMAIFWPHIGPKVPPIDGLLVELAGTRIAWFLFGVGLTAFSCMRIRSVKWWAFSPLALFFVCGLIFALTQLTETIPVYNNFKSVYDATPQLGKPLNHVNIGNQAYEAVHEHAIILWIRPLAMHFVLPTDTTQKVRGLSP
jgi:hypothetical protein